MPKPFEFLGESIFVPRGAGTQHDESGSGPGSGSGVGLGSPAAEDDGYVLTLLFNGRDMTSEFLIFDAQRVQDGPVSRLPLPTKVPFGLHGSFAPGLVGHYPSPYP